MAADWDQDGDLDLFIGARSIPGHYPETPKSRLLRNDEGRFVDVTNEAAPGLRKVGLVTGALWSDVENDGDVDLLEALSKELEGEGDSESEQEDGESEQAEEGASDSAAEPGAGRSPDPSGG